MAVPEVVAAGRVLAEQHQTRVEAADVFRGEPQRRAGPVHLLEKRLHLFLGDRDRVRVRPPYLVPYAEQRLSAPRHEEKMAGRPAEECVRVTRGAEDRQGVVAGRRTTQDKAGVAGERRGRIEAER